MSDDLANRILARVADTGADVLILPERVHEETGKGVYPQSTLLLVKRLRSEGVKADYLDASSDRYFVTQKSALLMLALTIGVGIATNAAWDGIKKVVSLMRDSSGASLTIKVTDASQTTPCETSVSGSPAQVIDALQQLKDRGLLPIDVTAPAVSKTSQRAQDGADEHDKVPPPPPSELASNRVNSALMVGNDLLNRSRTLLADSRDDPVEAEEFARQALTHFRSALDWAEDTDRESEAHETMDAAGRWTCESFGCELEYTDGTYYRTCPVDLGHNRVGLSVGGVATRICSLCDRDISDCEHDPSQEYLTGGGSSPLGYCRICMNQHCTQHQPHLKYPARPGSIITEMQVDEVSLVARPAQPDARIHRQSVNPSELKASIGDVFSPGMAVRCERCLGKCGGLTQLEAPSLER